MDEALPERARAAVAEGPGTTRLRDLPLPRPGADEGLLRVEATGVCPTDWERYLRGCGGVILGHETVGRVTALGERAAARWGVAVGDRIAVEEFLPCGTCRPCRRGDYRLCRAAGDGGGTPHPGYGRTPVASRPGLYGGFSDYLYLHPRSVVHPVGDTVDPRAATLFAPLSSGIRWVVRQARLRAGDTVVVLGTGRQGLGCVLAAHEAGAGTVIAVGPAARWQHLHLAKHLGAAHVVFRDEEAAVDGVRELTGGRGADIVVHLTPEPGTVAEAVAMAADRATVVLAAPDEGRIPACLPEDFPYDTVVRRELRMVGAHGHDHRSVEPALDIIRSGRYPLHLLTTHHFPVAETDLALRTVAGHSGEHALHVSVGA
ncbi:putative alcohol dehydrogenase adh [Streptomyces sulfonofaciens]|uniref:2-deoxy-scyllo-inosamine dehydrogenase n=1 Tax=Streptomyces sulfonofaciens TaxID=68272 RepID=A0A919GGZ6_9ACTN|nr:alcohol dehydrogenase catalytic domain-containing protein [Streptomyces sulfonofaciens]GHH83790.1 putative alcohol dehydrogenase adh [Streptomyces sulfonofaciens]